MRSVWALLPLAAMGACAPPGTNSSAQGDSPVRAHADPGDRNAAHRILVAKTEEERRLSLAQYMADNGERCGRVTRTFYQGSTPGGEVTWNIRCSSGRDWALLIEPDTGGSTTLTECGALEFLGIYCWRRFES